MALTFNKLLLNWKGPSTGRNYPVGVLQKKDGFYNFSYNKAVLLEAEKEGFTPLIGLDLDSTYESKKLFSVFERRLPNPSRNVFKRFYDNYKLEKSDDMFWDYLWITGGKLATDSLSFVTPIVYQNGYLRFSCEVAGWSHTKVFNRELEEKVSLKVEIDTENKNDSFAVELIDEENNNCRVGYIPRPFNLLFYRLLQKNIKVLSEVYYVNQDDKRPRVLVFTMTLSKHLVENESDLQYLIEYQ
ncbi:HIRAN domain-containing protein [Brevibacillus fortis]|uniref:HIRAN domain-containing protein n=1 Tax=Brevibacillus fortis TaxID=2126352 RepID=UPI002E1D2215|nr:HIRAN domain-containing protein [Brevibacillus fortis]